MIKKFAYYSNNHVPYWLVFALDMAIVAGAFCLSYFLRFNFSLDFDLNQLQHQLPVAVFAAALSFLSLGTFKNAIRYTGFSDIIALFKSVVLMIMLIGLFVAINNSSNIISDFTMPFSMLISYALLSITFLSFSRLFFRSVYKYLKYRNISTKRRVLIYGIGDASIMTYNAIINNVFERATVLGFINEGSIKNKKYINGLPIWSESDITAEFISNHEIDDIIISSEYNDGNKLATVGSKVKITKVPSIQSWINGELILNKFKHINVEDLLGRAPIKINNTNVAKEFVGETLLITGAASVLGKELVNQLINFNVKKLILIDQSEADLYDLQQDLKQQGKYHFVAVVADISDGLRIDMLFQEYKPTVVFHTAEYINEQLMEKSPHEAIKINVNGTKFLSDAASRYNAKKFIFVSTDKAINPTSSIGVTKRLAELYLTCLQKESKTKFITTRCGNIVETKGSIVSNFEKQIKSGGPVTIPHKDMTKFFTTLSEAAELILEAATMGKGGEIFIFDTGQAIKVYDIAKRMINLSGFSFPEDIDIKITGLSVGEKIHEELVADIEHPVYTYHKKVMILNTVEFNYAKIKSDIEELCFTNRFQHTDIVLKMKKLIPECEPNNTEYDRLYKRVQSYKKAKGILPEKTNQINIK
jgi:FlaA1/EpsC-like NDP-sugar epimerase